MNSLTIYRAGLALLLLLASSLLQASNKPYTTFGDHKVLHTVFNSSFIQPNIASAYNLTRGKDRALINVALIRSTESGNSNGLPAKVTGTVANLMQQQRSLEFIEIHEQNAVYYLAPLRFTNEEVLHFNLEVTPKGQGKSYTVKFSKKLYVD
ncbi:DUF4426 domain-containing protein [Pseudomaricurvus alkylphenolicus]|jgi:hypothetical protein|uniref:DUF4426 domain-containing protein n=1 Tax=Pseudomaricurvus alkylphenolicus TaxID=1306991 RepID=UPI00141E0AA0|nr:DUF4426 domain-containing protein [Pseudomaricurvus alkylphenolicus]NIB39389.1 DUF4426 domain-containing protein [Pseudomaricurvus alkylphenolicus]